MFGLGSQELIIILIIALFIFGAKKLPEIGKGLGKSIREFKSSVSGEDEQENSGKPKEINKEPKEPSSKG
jgi:sec-independent protein translocase protein TatA